jgi:hypothetical protein
MENSSWKSVTNVLDAIMCVKANSMRTIGRITPCQRDAVGEWKCFVNIENDISLEPFLMNKYPSPINCKHSAEQKSSRSLRIRSLYICDLE